MKSLAPLTLITSVLLASCGGGGGGDSSQDQALNDEGSLVTPVVPSPELPITPPVIDSAPQLGALSDLIGAVEVAYVFNGTTSPLLFIQLEFTANDFSVINGGSGLLFGNAETFSILSPSADPTQGSSFPFACSYIDPSDQFFCILDASGIFETFFLFDRLSNRTAQGSFEVCQGAITETCASNVLMSPDGPAVISILSPLSVSGPSAALGIVDSESSEKTDLLPYVQYLKQGSTEDDAPANLPSEHVDALIAYARSLKKALDSE